VQKFLSTHTFPSGAYTYDQICQLADASQREQDVRGYRSFLNLSGGKVVCILEGDDREAVAAWFDKMGISYDGIWPVELEGDRGLIHDLRRQPAMAGMA
jgi:hypothetical protein